MNKNINKQLFKYCNSEKEKEELINIVNSNQYLLSLIIQLIDEKYNEVDKEIKSTEPFSFPEWDKWVSSKLEFLSALKKVKSFVPVNTNKK